MDTLDILRGERKGETKKTERLDREWRKSAISLISRRVNTFNRIITGDRDYRFRLLPSKDLQGSSFPRRPNLFHVIRNR